MIKVMGKCIKWTSISLTSILLLLIALLGFVLFTNLGLNTVLWGAEKALPQLKVESTTGALLPSFTLNNVQFKDDALHIDTKVEKLALAINPRCLLDPKLCVDRIAIHGLELAFTELPAASPEGVEPTPPVTSVKTPLPIVINRIALSDIKLNILGHEIEWSLFSSALSMQGEQLTVSPTLFNDLKVKLAESIEEPPSDTVEPEPVTNTAIELPEVWIPLQIVLERFDLNRFTLEQETPVVVHHLGLEARVGQHAVDVSTLELDMPQASANLAAQVELKDGYPLQLTLDAQVKETDLAGQALSLKAQGSVAKLQLDSQFSELIEAKLSGEIQPLEPALPFDLLLEQGQVQWPLTGKSDYQATIEQFQADGSLDGFNVLLKGEADGKEIPELAIDLQGKGTTEQIELERLALSTLGGKLNGVVKVNWKNLVNWQAEVALQDIQPGLQWPEAEGKISGSLITTGELTEAGGWAIELPKLDIEGILREYPLDVQGQLSASDRSATGEPQLKTSGLSLAHGVNSIEAQGELDKQWDMGVVIHFPELVKSIPQLKGAVMGNIQLSGPSKEPEVAIALNVDNIDWNNEATLESLSLNGSVVPLPKPQADLVLKANNLTYQDQSVQSIDLTVNGGEKQHTVTLDVISDIVSASLAISGELIQTPSIIWDGSLDRVKITTEQGPWQLNQPVAIKADVDKQLADVQAHCWQQAGSSVCLDEDVRAGQSGAAKLSINQFDFEQIKTFLPNETQLQGIVNATAEAKWSEQGEPEVTVSLDMPKGQVVQQVGEPITLGWESVVLNAQLKDNQLNADFTLDVTENGDLSGTVALPDILAEDRMIDAAIQLTTFHLDFLEPILGEYSLLKAQLESDLKVQGSLMHPQVFGQFSVDGVQVKGDVTPVDINDGRIVVDFDGYSAKLDADIETPDGHLDLEGAGDWQDLQAWHSNVRIFADELMVEIPPMVKVKVVPDMTIEVTPELAKITGDIALPWGRIVVEDLPPSAVGVSSDQVILNKDLEPVNEDAVPFDVVTNINISIGDDFKLSAFGLEGELVGKLNVTQKDQGPFITGEVNIVDGTYQSFGQDLLIEEGKILMNGPADQPYVAINAVRNPDNTQDDVTAGIRVTGPATEPTIEIYSDPAMPQANALSYILRGQDIDGESSGSMTTTLIGLSLAKSGKVVGEIGEAFGVQDLQLDTAGSGDDSQVTVSGYILPGLQVKYGVGIFNSLGEFTVRYRLMQDLYIEAVSGLDSAVDLLYKFEFE
ncbi:translocation/assembly module TamB domain-containing protein [uncultured Vibrio sp.]|uniref:autotransporter assembly complex protein TamB n=1 Tax=uncultured Vibrio sp. TaxID=114054 RepID=UPI00262C0BEF|nr:translocation/assembly module TamB domain-containing protein [uncultured Vibrio sp.]